MGLVLARAQQHDGRDARRESGHGGRSLDWVRPMAPVAHRTERSAPDRKAAGPIPARRTSSRIRAPLLGRRLLPITRREDSSVDWLRSSALTIPNRDHIASRLHGTAVVRWLLSLASMQERI